MEKIGIVVLNYLNYKDTIECINSILKMNYNVVGIVIVDNNSNNKSFEILYQLYRKYKKIVVVKAKKNYGYARGNNIGIEIARKKFQADFVFIVNNDVIFTQTNFFVKLLDNYKEGIGVIGSTIELKNNKIQNKIMLHIDLKETILIYIGLFLKNIDKSIWLTVLPVLDSNKKVFVLHGCAIFLTPDFFKHYQGLYPRTFLYHEEEILYLMCKKYNLKQKYVEEASLYHKGDQSSEISFSNNRRIMLKYHLNSYKYVVWWAFKDKILNYLNQKNNKNHLTKGK